MEKIIYLLITLFQCITDYLISIQFKLNLEIRFVTI